LSFIRGDDRTYWEWSFAITVCETGCEREEYLASVAAMLKRYSFKAAAALLQ